VVELVLQTKHLPEALAKQGTVHVESKEVAKLIGKVGPHQGLSRAVDTAAEAFSQMLAEPCLHERGSGFCRAWSMEHGSLHEHCERNNVHLLTWPCMREDGLGGTCFCNSCRV
jgi:hypothetical protein